MYVFISGRNDRDAKLYTASKPASLLLSAEVCSFNSRVVEDTGGLGGLLVLLHNFAPKDYVRVFCLQIKLMDRLLQRSPMQSDLSYFFAHLLYLVVGASSVKKLIDYLTFIEIQCDCSNYRNLL